MPGNQRISNHGRLRRYKLHPHCPPEPLLHHPSRGPHRPPADQRPRSRRQCRPVYPHPRTVRRWQRPGLSRNGNHHGDDPGHQHNSVPRDRSRPLHRRRHNHHPRPVPGRHRRAQPVCLRLGPGAVPKPASTDGLAIIAAIPGCTVALGAFRVGNAASCLATNVIGPLSVGQDIGTCLTTAFSATCISALPAPFLGLAGNNVAQLFVNLPLCEAALGPFAAGAALTCLSSGATNGGSVISCLNGSLFRTIPLRKLFSE
ncbi:hypothetical protein LZ30DRAFT_685374 [Colletotrichum cereale]|nr:hypothetical protein LZ30DRAFT_685374 [Colletotrichum cereale]